MDLPHFWIVFFLSSCFFLLVFSDPNGFLSISCGGTKSYTDSSNISWVPDTEYITTGNISTTDQNNPVRFFPANSQVRKCYELPLKNYSSLVLIRARFMYNNYDRFGKPPTFSISLGTAITSTVNLSTNDPWTEEFIWSVNKDILSVCLHSIPNSGNPVISSLEIRPLPQGAYRDGIQEHSNHLLRKSYRLNCGYNNGSLRYPLDSLDRIWDGDGKFIPFHSSTGFKIMQSFNLKSGLRESPPLAVLQTARVLARRDLLTYNFDLKAQGDYFIILYFAGILPVYPSFDVLINEEVVESNYTIRRSDVSSIHVTKKEVNRSLNITFKSVKFYPQVNAIEVYEIVGIPLEASSTTVSALEVIQQSTGFDLGWEDDPCSPKTWEHLGCEGNLVTYLDLSNINLRSINPTLGDLLDLKILDLHNTSLEGAIENLESLLHIQKLNLSFNQLTSFGSEMDNLISLQVLDLKNNTLQGTVPVSLGELEDLHLLNLENNELEGPLPQSLNKESLEIRTLGNKCLSFSTMACDEEDLSSSNTSIETPHFTIIPKKKHARPHNHILIVLGAVSGALLAAIFVILLLVFLYKKKHRTDELTYSAKIELRNWNMAKVFSYKEIKAATNNFKQIIGSGSFGNVYLGKLPGGKMVAVKVRFDKSQLATDSFINEVHLLSRIHHQNLVCLEGFCHESKKQILVYEYLAAGSLADHLYGTNSKKVSLSWVRRLKIAIDAAKGLDYLHNGNEPRIIHRDVKCSNILLDMEMNGKVCDFGLSKQLTRPDATHVTTAVKGTAGYLDPEYYSTQQLTEKSDVYSFGVVLLELICGREPLSHSGTPDSFNLVLWAKPYLQAGAYEIVDESLRGSFDEESMKTAALVAVKCVERDASHRPKIAEVLAELKHAYSIQIAYLATSNL